ncbi:hypothetical protein [Parafrankia sp. EUN1f]|uniref:hypothetical protein n=1 Tax=Parafrankia sp. EUN1f TaxID=102897 RepID=UPI0001C44AEA|nr:hypothetical protein [Parafrankia sp. EUN1f]EFC83330.1 hypothetical protein FrEUN1fDRAFT_3509 [Parafrankia sp. EUN1f]
MVDAAIELELADVRGIRLDQLRDSTDEALRAGVRQLLHVIDTSSFVWSNGGGGSCKLGAPRLG